MYIRNSSTRELLVDGEGLGHVAERAADLAVVLDRVVPGDPDRARRGHQQRREHPDRRRLAGAVGSDQPEALAGRDGQRQIVDGRAIRLVPIGDAVRAAITLASWHARRFRCSMRASSRALETRSTRRRAPSRTRRSRAAPRRRPRPRRLCRATTARTRARRRRTLPWRPARAPRAAPARSPVRSRTVGEEERRVGPGAALFADQPFQDVARAFLASELQRRARRGQLRRRQRVGRAVAAAPRRSGAGPTAPPASSAASIASITSRVARGPQRRIFFEQARDERANRRRKLVAEPRRRLDGMPHDQFERRIGGETAACPRAGETASRQANRGRRGNRRACPTPAPG